MLRERGFGVCEGGSIDDFLALAERANPEKKENWFAHTPEGGETVQQLADRAKQFVKVFFHF